MKEFTFRLKADVSYLEEQFKGGAEALKALAVQADKADDKLQVLKQVGAYIGQMDAALAKVQKKYPNLFDEIFGDVNKQITEALSPLKKMPDEMNKILSKSKIKLDSLIADPGAATVSEIKEIGDAFKAVAKAMGNTSIDFKFLDGASKNEAKIKKLVKAMRELEESYFNVNKVVASEVTDVVTPQKQKKTTKKTKKEQTVDSMSYDDLLKTVKEAKELSKKIDEGDDDAFDKLDNKINSLQKVFKLSEDGVAQLDFIIQELDDDLDTTMGKLEKLLGPKFPPVGGEYIEKMSESLDETSNAATAASKAVDNVGDSQKIKLQIESYEDLCRVIERFNELLLKSKTGLSNAELDERNEISTLLGKMSPTPDVTNLDEFLKAGKVDLSGEVRGTYDPEKMAKYFGIEIPKAVEKSETAIDETNQKLKEQEDLYQQVRAAIKGTLEEVVGMDFTAVALEDIEREIKDGLITTLEEAIIRFKEMNNLTDDITIRPVGEYQRVAESWDYYQGNKYVGDDEKVVNAEEYDALKQKTSGESIGDEYNDLELLRRKVEEVEAAVINKTLAFNQEADAVEINVKSEIDYLEMLCKKLQDVLQDIQNINNNKLHIADANEIDSIFAKLSDPSIKNEYLGLLNSKTGKVSSEYFEGGTSRTEGIFKNKKDYDTMFHNHPDVSTAIPSAKDWDTFVDEFANFKRQIIITKDEIATFDLSGITEQELKELANTIKSTLDTSRYGKQWTKDVVTYGDDEATQLWTKRQTMGALSKYPGLMSVQSLRPEQIGFTDEQLTPKVDIVDEAKEINTLENAVDKVKIAINNKTEAFENEKNLTAQYVQDEINELQKLINKLQKVQESAKIKLSIEKDENIIDNVKESTRYVTDKYGEIKTWYRGLRDSMGGGLVSNRYHGGTFFTDNLDLAKEYSDYTKVESANLSMMNPLEIEGNGANWNRIEYLGNSADEASVKIKKAKEELDKLLNEWNGFKGLQINDLLSEDDFNEFKSKLNGILYAGEDDLPDNIRDTILDALAKVTKNRDDYFSVSNDDSNIYGTHDTNKFVEYAQSAGYDGVVFKNIIDSFSGNVKDMSNVIVAFNKDQIHYLDTISVDEKERKQQEFNSKYKNFGEYGEYDELRVSNAIEEIVENVRKIFNGVDETFKRGFISDTEANNVKQNTLIDSKFDAYSSAQNIGSPEFLDFVKNSDIDIWGKDANEVMQLFEQFVEDAHNEWNSLQNDIASPVETKIEDAVQETKEQEVAEKEVAAVVDKTNDKLDEQIAKKEKLSELELGNQRGTLNLFSKDLKDSESALLPEQREAYEQLVATVNEYKKSKEKIDDAEIARIREIVSGYKSAADVKKREIETTEAQAAATKKAKDIQDKLNKSLSTKKADGQWNSAKANATKYADSSIVQENFAIVEQAYTALQNAKQRYADRGTELSDKEQLELDELVRNFSAAYGKLNKIVSDSEKLSGNKGKIFESPVDPSAISDMDKLEQAMRQAATAATGGKAKFEGFDKTTGELSYKLGVAGGKFEHFKVQIDSTGTKLVGLNTGLKKTNGFLRDIADSTLSKMRSAIGNITGYDLIYRLVNVTKQGIQYIRDIDSALTELKKVTDETEESYAKFLQTASKTSSVIGSTVADFTNATADFARLGYSVAEAAQLAEAASIYKNVGDGITDVAQASESIISTMKAFGIEAKDAMGIVDRFNEIGNNFAISSTGIGDALQRSASALAAAGNSIDESIALITAANTVVQNPEQVGTALKTLSMRLRGTKVELEEAGEDTDGMAESVSQLQKELLALSHNKVNIMADADTYKNSTEILREMADAWGEMTDAERAAALELMGGKRQGNILASVIENFDIVDDVIEKSLDAENSAIKENEKYLDSIEGKTKQFTNSVQTMWMNAINSDTIKGFVDFGTSAINILDKMIQTIGTIPTLLALVAAGFSLWKFAPKLIADLFLKIKQSSKATDEDTSAKLKNEIQSAKLSKKVKEEALGRVYSKEAIEAETTALNANTEAKIKNEMADKADVDIDAPGIDLNKTGDIVDDAADAIDDVADSGKVAKKVVKEVGEEAVEAAVETAAAGAAAAGATKAAGAGLAGVGAKILTFLTSTAGVVTLFVAGIAAITGVLIYASKGFDRAKKKLEETTEALETTQDTIKSLNSELKTTQERIDELNGKDTLTISEQEELDKLIAQNEELERQIRLEEQREKILKKQQALDLKETFDRDNSLHTTTSTVYDENGVATTVEVDPAADRLASQYEQQKQRVEDAQKALEEAQAEYEKVMGTDQEGGSWWNKVFGTELDPKNKLEAAEKALENAKAMLAGTEQDIAEQLKHIEETYGSAEWQTGDNLEPWQKDLNEDLEVIYEAQYKLAMATDETGQMAEDAFNWVASRDDVGDFVDKVKEIENLDTTNIAEIPGFEEFIQELIDVGFIADDTPESIQKIIDAFNAAGEAAGNAAPKVEDFEKSLTTVVGDISKFEKGIGELSDVYNQFLDEGVASAESLEGLQETFGVGAMAEEYENFVRILGDSSSTISDVQNAIEKMAGIYLSTIDLAAGVAEEDIAVISSELERLGVQNAEQLVKTRIYAYNELKDVYGFDITNFTSAEDAKNAYLSDILDEHYDVNADLIDSLAEQYDFDLNNFINVGDEKVAEAREDARKIAQAYAAAESQKVIAKYQAEVEANPDDLNIERRAKEASLAASQNAYAKAMAQFDALLGVDLSEEHEKAYKEVTKKTYDYFTRPDFNFERFKDIGGGAGSSKEDALAELDWIDHYFEAIDNRIEANEAKLEDTLANVANITKRNDIINAIIADYKKKMPLIEEVIDEYSLRAQQLYNSFSPDVQQKINNGSLKISEYSDELANQIQEYFDYIGQKSDWEIELANLNITIDDYELQKFNNIVDAYENELNLEADFGNRVQAKIDLLEEQGERVSEELYKAMIRGTNTQLNTLREERTKLQNQLNAAMANGIEKGSTQWYEMVTAINDVDAAIIEAETSIESFNNAIQDLHWEAFDILIDRISSVADEAENLRDLLDTEKVLKNNFSEGYLDGLTELDKKLKSGKITAEQYTKEYDKLAETFKDAYGWTADGTTALGLLTQEMENAKYRSNLYAKEIKDLTANYKALGYSEDEYQEKLQELKDGQWDAIDAYESAKDAVLELNEARVEEIKDGIQKQIDAYEELIEKQKESLQQQREQHELAKEDEEYEDEVAAIQRKIRAMENDTSASSVAQQKLLRAELAKLEEERRETEYEREMDSKEQALDDSLELYTEGKEAIMDAWDEYLTDEEQVMADSYANVTNNVEAIQVKIKELSDHYGIQISDAVTQPWEDAQFTLDNYTAKFETATSTYITKLGTIKTSLESLETQANATAKAFLAMLEAQAMEVPSVGTGGGEAHSSGTQSQTNNNKNNTSSGGGTTSTSSKTPTKGSTVTVSTSATNFSSKSGNASMASFVKGGSYTVMQTSGNQVLIGKGGVATGWVNKSDLKGYSTGTLGTKKNELAWVDENGLEEIVMHAQNGRLAYLTKGSSVIPHDISENLMELGKVDPKTWLDNHRPTSVPASFVTQNNNIDLKFASLINIEHADKDSIPEINAAVQKQLDSYMKTINNGIKRYSR